MKIRPSKLKKLLAEGAATVTIGAVALPVYFSYQDCFPLLWEIILVCCGVMALGGLYLQWASYSVDVIGPLSQKYTAKARRALNMRVLFGTLIHAVLAVLYLAAIIQVEMSRSRCKLMCDEICSWPERFLPCIFLIMLFAELWWAISAYREKIKMRSE